MRTKPLHVVWLVIAIGCSYRPAAAATIAFADRAAWNLAAPGNTVIDFEGIAPAGSAAALLDAPLVIGNATFTADAQAFVIDDASPFSGPYQTSDYYEWQVGLQLLTVNMAAPLLAIGFDYGTFFGGTADELRVTLDNGFSVNVIAPLASYGFLGLVSDTPFSTVLIEDITPIGASNAGRFPTIDNFSYVTAATVPEPSSFLLFGTGAAAMVVAVRRRRKQQVQ